MWTHRRRLAVIAQAIWPPGASRRPRRPRATGGRPAGGEHPTQAGATIPAESGSPDGRRSAMAGHRRQRRSRPRRRCPNHRRPELHQRVGDTLTAAFPDRLWLCGEVVGTPAVRAGGAGDRLQLGRGHRRADQHAPGVARATLLPGTPPRSGGRGHRRAARRREPGHRWRPPAVRRAVQQPGVGRPAGAQPGRCRAVSQQREALREELAAAGLLGRQRALARLPLAPVRVGIVAGGAGTVGYTDAVTVLQQSGHQVEATHFRRRSRARPRPASPPRSATPASAARSSWSPGVGERTPSSAPSTARRS